MPVELQKLVDFMSIKREKLIAESIAKPEFISAVLSGADIEETEFPMSSLMAGCSFGGELDRSAGTAWRRAFDLGIWRSHWAEAFPETSSYWDVSATPSV